MTSKDFSCCLNFVAKSHFIFKSCLYLHRNNLFQKSSLFIIGWIVVTWKKWPLGVEFTCDASHCPNINWRTVIGGTQ
jgi:hypothetical protein